ncbi:MAG TPA: ankyrin repeat domain-containing protein [Bryobacteraceae bacterium]|nr:ankyrin repeat domain-containing protein [Bryobacteraceae bacterium]
MLTVRRTLVPALLALRLCGAGMDTRVPDAARQMKKAEIRTLLERHADPNALQVDGTTALHWAAYQDDFETVQLLLRARANVKAANRYGVTPLALAAMNGNGKMVELLLQAGADPNTSLPGGETALMTAARTGKMDAVKALLAGGADIHAKETHHGQTALMWAAAEGHAQVVAALIQAGADFRQRLESGFTPFLFAVREGHLGVVQTLLKAGANVNETVETVKPSERKLASGAGAPRAGTSALVLAVLNGHFELAASLLDASADPNAGAQGYTALHAITWVRKPGGGDNDPAPQGSGNLTSLALVKKLVASGANTNARMSKKISVGLTGLNTLGATPFLLAARTADAELMRFLASLGADPLLPNADNSTPLMAAAGLGTRSPGEDAGTEREVLEAVQAALDLGANIDAVDNNGETAMHGAAYKNLPAVVQLLADKGANIEVWNRKNKHGWTPLIIAEGHRFGNFKPSPDTIAAFHRVLRAAGVATVAESEPAAGVGRVSK